MNDLLKNFDFKDKVIHFIHIPKTSGSSLKSKQIIKYAHKFNVPNIRRSTVYYKTDTWPQYRLPKDDYKITIIRNPFDLLCSYYFHQNKNRETGEMLNSGWGYINFENNFDSFKDFIIGYCNNETKWNTPAFKNFLFSQLFDENGKCVVDIIIKYEYRNEAIDILNEKLEDKIDKTIKINQSNNKKKSYKDYYDDEMIRLVNKKCARELEWFNYDFNGSTIYEPIIINPTIKYDVYRDLILD